MWRKIVLTGIGDLGENVALDTNPDLTLGANDVLVAMEAAPINPVDFLFAAGWYSSQPTIGQGLGSEGVGRVVETGSAIDPELLGSRVIVLANQEQGTWADKAVVPARNVVAVGEDGSAAQFSQLSINAATALALLTQFDRLQPADWVGQTIGNGAVAQYVIRLARHAGYKSLSIVRTQKAAEQARATGGDRVLLLGEDLGARVAEALGDRQLDLVLDGEGGETVGYLAQSLKSHGTIVSYSSITNTPPLIAVDDLILRELKVTGFWLVNWLHRTPRNELERVYAELAALAATGDIGSTVEAVYPLGSYREAIAHAALSGRAGKVLFAF